jgi:hypothetical protein
VKPSGTGLFRPQPSAVPPIDADKETARLAGRLPYSVTFFVIVIASAIPVAVTIPVWLNDNDLIPAASKLTIPAPITVTTVTIINSNPSATGANTEFNALGGCRSGS